jgi:bifunctional N-acetylglucosamine-1-phosphate-uridyltransferase/glucosamine-1-phosphate-acetyltransferase GlmU-like protein
MNSIIPKVLHLVDNIPMIVRIINEAKKLKPSHILLVVGQYKSNIEEKLKEYNLLYDVNFIIQEKSLGTGHAIQCCKKFLYLNGNPEDKVLILSGDTPLVSKNLMEKMLNFNDVKIMITSHDNPSGYGRIKMKQNKFKKIVEHKDCNQEELKIKEVNCGIYSFKNELLFKYLNYLKNDNKQNEYYLTDLIEILNQYYDIELYKLKKDRQYQLMNVNTQKQLEEINFFLKKIF